MSSNARNLTYESHEPAFLRKLKGEYGGADSARRQRQLARPKKQRNLDEEDDEPVYVNETEPHEPISKADYDALLNAATTEQGCIEETQPVGSIKDSEGIEHPREPRPEGAPPQEAGPNQQMAMIGATSKKRPAKVVRDNDPADEVPKPTGNPLIAATKRPKKAKRPKLSFQDE